MLSIGEFSRVTQLSIKALRLYHEKGILIPGKIDLESNYRYYQGSAVEKGLIIKRLKDMGFSLEEIKTIVRECVDDQQMIPHVEAKLKEVQLAITKYEELKETLAVFLDSAKGEKMGHSMQIEREALPGAWICGIRFKGKYNEVGPKFGTLLKKCGRHAYDKPFSLYYDGEYKEEDADIEACVMVKRKISAEGVESREFKGGNAVTLIHQGPYDELGQSYRRLFEYCRENDLKIILPIMEQYIKGPGMIFKGNPKKYITRLIIFHDAPG